MTALASPPRPASGGRIWAWVPFLLLGGLLGTQLFVLRNVLDDPSVATEPDYYRKAVAWDEQRELERRSVALGWRAVLELQPAARPGFTRLIVDLTDRGGGPLSGATLTAQAFANARAGQIVTLRWRESAPGHYESELGPGQPGLWEVRLQASRGADTFVQVIRPTLMGGAAP
jgi:nitrogen fixation protein FixH